MVQLYDEKSSNYGVERDEEGDGRGAHVRLHTHYLHQTNNGTCLTKQS